MQREPAEQGDNARLDGDLLGHPPLDSLPSVTGLVHDYLLVMRGAERTFAEMGACFPYAGIYTLLYDEQGTGGVFAGRVARTSMLQPLRARQRGFRRLLPLYPLATDRLDLGDHDVLLSSSSAFAHGVRPRSCSAHICYCHTPFRYVWHERERALREVPPAARPLLARSLERIRRWDLEAVQRVDHIIANSRFTQERIGELWGREATIVHPPVDVDRFRIAQPEDYFLIVSELVPHKRAEEALLAAERAGCRVKVVGTGPDLSRLRRRFAKGAEFLGRVPDPDLPDLMARARALIVPSIEEFGIVGIESQAAGRPVLAPDRGGTTETVIDGTTGVLFAADDFDALAAAMRDVDWDRFDRHALRRWAARFGTDVFRMRLQSEVLRLSGAVRSFPPSDVSWRPLDAPGSACTTERRV